MKKHINRLQSVVFKNNHNRLNPVGTIFSKIFNLIAMMIQSIIGLFSIIFINTGNFYTNKNLLNFISNYIFILFVSIGSHHFTQKTR